VSSGFTSLLSIIFFIFPLTSLSFWCQNYRYRVGEKVVELFLVDQLQTVLHVADVLLLQLLQYFKLVSPILLNFHLVLLVFSLNFFIYINNYLRKLPYSSPTWSANSPAITPTHPP
jgi:hypothetical protein